MSARSETRLIDTLDNNVRRSQLYETYSSRSVWRWIRGKIIFNRDL